MLAAHAGDGIGLSPTVAVEHRKGVDVDVAVTDRRVPPERHRIRPGVAMGDLHALGARRGSGRVVDGGAGVLVGFPRGRLGLISTQRCEERSVGDTVERDEVFDLDVLHHVVLFRIDQEHPRPRVLHDVGDLLGVETEVDRHENTSVARRPPERKQELRRVRTDDRHPVSHTDAHVLQAARHASHARPHLGVGQCAERADHSRFVDDPDAIAVDSHGPVEKVSNSERNLHGISLGWPASRHAFRRFVQFGRLSDQTPSVSTRPGYEYARARAQPLGFLRGVPPNLVGLGNEHPNDDRSTRWRFPTKRSAPVPRP